MSVVMEKVSFSGLTKTEVALIKTSLQDLGTFTFHKNVERSTTYLITKLPFNRTLNMVFGMAYGCKIINKNWVNESFEIGRLLPYEQYLITELSTPVKEFQAQRGKFDFNFPLFHNFGRIYVANNCNPSARQLKRLVHACGGKCTPIESKAYIVVGKTRQIKNNVKESWILDCITEGMVLTKDQYLYDDQLED